MKIDKNDVINAGHEETWIYFTSAYNAYEAMRAYRHLIKECLDRKKANFENIIKGETEISEKEKMSFPPGDFVTVDGINVSLRFLVSIYTQSFFQAGRNCLDYLSQIIGIFFCQDTGFYNIDFCAVIKRKDSIRREDVRAFIEKINTSEYYKYLCDYNNTVKHNYDPGVPIYVQTNNLDMIGKMPAFSKDVKKDEVRNHDAKDMDEQMKNIHQFVVDAYGDLLKLIWPEKAAEDT